MRFFTKAGASKDLDDDVSRRRFGRLPQDTLRCNLGPVLDLSAGGMRILCKRVPKHQVQVEIEDYTLPGPLLATPTWSKRVGLFRFEVGLRFDDLTAEMSRVLSPIAAQNRCRRVMDGPKSGYGRSNAAA